MAKDKVQYSCNYCGYISPSYLGKCPECESWSSFTETRIRAAAKAPSLQKREELSQALGGRQTTPIPLQQVQAEYASRYTSGYGELDRVLGGGILPGSYVLIGGDPGIGKSTLMLQMAEKIAQQDKTVLYVAGEESPYQIKMRADRLGLISENMLILPETNIDLIVEQIRALQPAAVVIDSIQSVYSPELGGTPGSMAQIRDCAGILMDVAKTLNITIFLVGHVTKEGAVSGPKLLEHTVDAVLYFEGDKYRNLRILRTVKNRFGSTQEIGVFEIQHDGLQEVANPSQLFLSTNSYQNHPGSVIVASLEGSRPILVELQALVGQSTYPSPRRVANGVEHNRLNQIVAVLERRVGLDFSHQDIYVNVVGGLKIDEPAADLGIALAIITSHRNISMLPGTVVSGEIGLTGEVRPISQAEKRIRESERIGFSRMILPVLEEPEMGSELELVQVNTLLEALQAGLMRERDTESRSFEEKEPLSR